MLSVISIFFVSHDLYALKPPRRRRPRAKPLVKNSIPAKKYKYTKEYDLNKDGKIDKQDRLIWAETRKNGFTPVTVTSENRAMYRMMDFDENGRVTKSEFTMFYESHDLNDSGILEPSEIRGSMKE